MPHAAAPRPKGRISTEILVAGMFGGMAPNLAGVAENLIRQGNSGTGLPLGNPGFWIATFIVGLLGGALVFFYKETNAHKAIALGAAAPALLLGMAQGGPGTENGADPSPVPAAAEVGARGGRGTEAVGLMVSVATLAKSGGPAAWQQDSLSVRLVGLESARGAAVDIIPVLGVGNGRLREGPPRRVRSGEVLVGIPGEVRSIYLRVDGTPSNRLTLPAATSRVTVKLEVSSRRFLSGMARAIGRKINERKVEITLVARDSGGGFHAGQRRL